VALRSVFVPLEPLFTDVVAEVTTAHNRGPPYRVPSCQVLTNGYQSASVRGAF